MTVKTSPRLPFNGDVLHWAREWRGKTLEEAAQKLRTKKDKISSWEKGESVPTARQARMLADFYERGFLEFFLPEPPELNESELVPDYRLDRNATPHDDRELWHIQRWAETQHLNAIDLYDMLEESPPVIPPELKATLKTDPERIAKKVRQAANFPIQRQLDLTGNDRQSLPKLIRAAFESIGVLVLRGKGLSKHSVRGISIAKFPLPTIVFGNEAITAQPFTLAHELGHILLHQSGISGPPSARDSNTPEKAVERWCDKFAAAFLIPLDELERHLEKPNQPMPEMDEETLNRLATTFRISRHAMLIRLVNVKYVEPGFYWNVMRPRFLEKEAEPRTGGGKPRFYGIRHINIQGNLYTGLVLEAWNRGTITIDGAARFMGIKKLQHLEDIRQEYRV